MYGARKPLSVGVNASLGVEPQAHAQATVNNTVIVNPTGAESEVVTRSTEIDSQPEAAKTRNTVENATVEFTTQTSKQTQLSRHTSRTCAALSHTC